MLPPPPEVAALRAGLDEVDHAILDLIARRRALVRALFSVKRRLGVPLIDPEREAALLRDRCARAEQLGVPPALAERIVRALLADSHEQA